jgi:hypothetical protein
VTGGYFRVEGQRKASKVRMAAPLNARSRRKEQHRVQSHAKFRVNKRKKVFVDPLSEGRKAHEATGGEVGFLQAHGPKHSVSGSKFGHPFSLIVTAKTLRRTSKLSDRKSPLVHVRCFSAGSQFATTVEALKGDVLFSLTPICDSK